MKSTRPKAAFVVMILYADALFVLGLAAYWLAPDKSNALTALIVPGVCMLLMHACAVMSRMLDRNRALGMIGIHAGLVLPLVFAVAFAVRGAAAAQGVEDHRVAADRYVAAVRSGDIANDTAEARGAFMARQVVDGRKAPEHDKSTLRNILYALSGLSAAAFVVLLTLRPKPTQRSASQEPRVQADPES